MAPLAESEKLKALHEAAKTAARHLAQAQEREYAALDVITQANKALLNGVEWYDAHFALGNLTDSVNMRTSVTGNTPAPPPPVRGREFKADAEAVGMKLGFLIDSATARASVQATPHDAADPIDHTLKAPGTNLLPLKCDELLSTLAFKLKLRRYSLGRHLHPASAYRAMSGGPRTEASRGGAPSPNGTFAFMKMSYVGQLWVNSTVSV